MLRVQLWKLEGGSTTAHCTQNCCIPLNFLTSRQCLCSCQNSSHYKMNWGKPIFHYKMTCQKSSSSFHPHQSPSTKCPAKIFQASWLQNDMCHPTLKRLILTRIMIYGGTPFCSGYWQGDTIIEIIAKDHTTADDGNSFH